MKIEATILRQEFLSEADREKMLKLQQRYFSHVLRKKFYRDLEEKQWVIVLRVGTSIEGFSTVQIISLSVAGKEIIYLFSGDTIVDRSCWNSPALAGSFGQVILKAMEIAGERDLYWFLISKGFRTYRFLPVFFNEFYPRFDRPTPSVFQALLDAVAQFKFGDSYDMSNGIVHSNGTNDHLRPFMQKVNSCRTEDPHIQFFLKKNPGYTRGDELVCIAQLNIENMCRSAWWVIRNTAVTWKDTRA